MTIVPSFRRVTSVRLSGKYATILVKTIGQVSKFILLYWHCRCKTPSNNLEKAMRPFRIVLISLILLASCSQPENSNSHLAGAADNINALPKRNDRRDFCGVELYNVKADAACGVATYRNLRSSNCGIENYNLKADLGCPGSISSDYKEFKRFGGCDRNADEPNRCDSGYNEVGSDKRETTCVRHSRDNDY